MLHNQKGSGFNKKTGFLKINEAKITIWSGT